MRFVWQMLVLGGVCSALYYGLIFTEVPEASMRESDRDLDSVFKLIFNGYLGQFFRFKFIGNVHWLFLFVAAGYLLKFRTWADPERALGLAYIMGAVVIAVQGYYNARYQLSFFPFTFSLLAIGVYEHLERNGLLEKAWRTVLLAVVMLLGNYAIYALEDFLDERAKEQPAIAGTVASQSFGDHLRLYWENMVPALDSFLFEYKPERRGSDIFRRIDSLELSSKVLVNNQPMLYYYTDKIGVYYWCGKDIVSTAQGRFPLLSGRTLPEVHRFIRDSLECGYVFSTIPYNAYNVRFEEYLRQYADTVFQQSHYVFYSLKDEGGG